MERILTKNERFRIKWNRYFFEKCRKKGIQCGKCRVAYECSVYHYFSEIFSRFSIFVNSDLSGGAGGAHLSDVCRLFYDTQVILFVWQVHLFLVEMAMSWWFLRRTSYKLRIHFINKLSYISYNCRKRGSDSTLVILYWDGIVSNFISIEFRFFPIDFIEVPLLLIDIINVQLECSFNIARRNTIHKYNLNISTKNSIKSNQIKVNTNNEKKILVINQMVKKKPW